MLHRETCVEVARLSYAVGFVFIKKINIKINIFMKKTILAVLFLAPVFVFATIDVNLKYGSKGLDVVELQEFLIDKGWSLIVSDYQVILIKNLF